ncbi:hypothetical protein C2E23DRAFT_738021 [Lenzites betulinus]|nr:hypothetical protein C2E23DRAFT_738021 [Lenzites betulinus]
MTVIHDHGIHKMAIKYCRCRQGDNPVLPEPLQLIRFGLFPGSWDCPETAYAINTLRDYHLLSMQLPITAMDYVAYLRRTTDSVQPDDAKDRYRELNTAMREFTFLRATRRAGQDPLKELPLGSLAVACPACPQPNVNMAADWATRSEKDMYLDMLFYSVDGNFHHSQKMKPMDPADFPLTQGAAYFVDEKDFADYQARVKPPKKEESSCNKFAALGNGRYSGRVSGMVGMTCSRHMFVIANSLVDLLRGEGFAWGDFSQLSGLQPWLHVLKLLCRGYDVNCQYDKKLGHRLAEFRKNFSHLKSIKTTTFPPTRSLIPKFHAPAHILICSIYRSYNYTPGVGMTDGEAAERIWSAFNALAIRTKEMSAGHRHDVINDFHGDMNVRRVHAMPQFLASKHKNATKQLAAATIHLAALESNIGDASVLAQWRQAEAVWERDVVDSTKHKALQNPYVLNQAKGLTEKQLVDMMNIMRAARNGQSTGPMSIVHRGTLLERKREQLLDELEDDGSFDDIQSALRLRCEEFVADIAAWNLLRDAYIGPLVAVDTVDTASAHSSGTSCGTYPADFPLRDTSEDFGSLENGLPPARNPAGRSDLWQEVFATPIVLPSSYDRAILHEHCMQELVNAELEVRRAQARDALDDVRTSIIGREAYKIKKTHASSKQYTTRATQHIRNMEGDVREAANRYRRVRLALLALGMDPMDPEFRPLRKGDTVKYTLDAQNRTLGESSESKPWIWEKFDLSDTHGPGLYRDFYDEARRVHWFRSSATQRRWKEEVCLLQEEMRRSVRFFTYHRQRWTAIAAERDRTSNAGAAAYARKQAQRYSRLLDRCEKEYAGRIDIVSPRRMSWSCHLVIYAQDITLCEVD